MSTCCTVVVETCLQPTWSINYEHLDSTPLTLVPSDHSNSQQECLVMLLLYTLIYL